MSEDKYVDESWKESAFSDKGKKEEPPIIGESSPPEQSEPEVDHAELNFLNYLSSLVFQSMIFLGDMPNPVTNKSEKNLPQAKFLIDTLSLLRDKTKGNLTKEEEDLLNGSVYELQMRYVDVLNQERTV